METGFDKAQRAYDANTEPPEPGMCPSDQGHAIDPSNGSIEWDGTVLSVQCADCEAEATFTVDGEWQL